MSHTMTKGNSKYFKGKSSRVKFTDGDVALLINDFVNSSRRFSDEITKEVLESLLDEVDYSTRQSDWMRHCIALEIEELNQ